MAFLVETGEEIRSKYFSAEGLRKSFLTCLGEFDHSKHIDILENKPCSCLLLGYMFTLHTRYVICIGLSVFIITLPKTNVAPENGWLEDEMSFRDSLFSGAMLISGSVYYMLSILQIVSNYEFIIICHICQASSEFSFVGR